nr:MAG TPA: hypothetical protein [Caudoviricetes sp.]
MEGSEIKRVRFFHARNFAIIDLVMPAMRL